MERSVRSTRSAAAAAAVVAVLGVPWATPAAAVGIPGSAPGGPGMEPVRQSVVARILSAEGSTSPASCYDGFATRSDRRIVVVQTGGGPCNGVFADGWGLYRRVDGDWTGPLVVGFPGVPSRECRTVRPRLPVAALRDLRAGGFCAR